MQLEIPGSIDPLRSAVRVMQVIVVALMTGASFFLGIAIFLVESKQAQPIEGLEWMPQLGIVAALVAIVTNQWVPRTVTASGRRAIVAGTYPTPSGMGSPSLSEGTTGQLCLVHQTKLIVGVALLEGATFFNGVTYLLTGSKLSLGMAVGLVILLRMMVPTCARLAAWIDEQQRLLADEQALVR